MVAKHGPADIDDFHRKQTEACQPRPVVIDGGTGAGFIALDKIVRWAQDGTSILIVLMGAPQAVSIYDPERRVDTALRQAFRVVTP